MRKKQIWQPALRKLFSFPSPDDRQEALKFLLQTMKKFQVVLVLRFCPGLHSLFACVYTLSDPLRNRSGMWDQTPPIPPPPSPSPSLGIIWNGKLILIARRVNKRKKQNYIILLYLNKLPNILVWKQTFFRGWKKNENTTKSSLQMRI